MYKRQHIKGIRPYSLNKHSEIKSFYDLGIIDYNNELDHCNSFENEEVFVYKKKSDSIFFLKSEKVKCLDDYRVNWFPPYMTRVKKIDYSKFPDDIQEAIIAIDKGKTFDQVESVLKKVKSGE